MDIKAGIQTAIVIVILGVLLALWVGAQSIRSGSKLSYYRLRQERIAQGWSLIILALFLAGAAWWLGNFGESVAYQYYPPSPTPSLTPGITLTPTITLTPSISPTPTISNTPAVSNTPTITPTPFVPAAVASKFTSLITPNPDAIFSPLVFARSMELTSYQPVDPATTFKNPIKSLVVFYNYDKMIPGVQWTALWYRGGTLIHYDTALWQGTTGGYDYTEWAPDPSEWLPGDYEVQLFVGMDWKMSGGFTVLGQAPTPRPSPQPSATITPTPTPKPPPTAVMSPTPFPTLTPIPSNTRPPTSTPKPSLTPLPTDTSWPSATPKFSPTRTMTPTPIK